MIKDKDNKINNKINNKKSDVFKVLIISLLVKNLYSKSTNMLFSILFTAQNRTFVLTFN